MRADSKHNNNENLISHPNKQQIVRQDLSDDDSQLSDFYIDEVQKIPRLLNKRYSLVQQIGNGAHGRIYHGMDMVNKVEIAVKIMDRISKNKSK